MAWSPPACQRRVCLGRLPGDYATAPDRRSVRAGATAARRRDSESPASFPADDAAGQVAGVGRHQQTPDRCDAANGRLSAPHRHERMNGPIARCRANRRAPNNVGALACFASAQWANRKALVSLASDKQPLPMGANDLKVRKPRDTGAPVGNDWASMRDQTKLRPYRGAVGGRGVISRMDVARGSFGRFACSRGSLSV